MPFLNLRQQKFKNSAEIKAFFASQTAAQRQAFAGFVALDNRYKELFPSQTRIGALGGATLTSAKRWLKKWKDMGFVESQNRKSHIKDRNLTCRYALHPIFYEREARETLSTLPEFGLVFKLDPVPRQVVPPYARRIKPNINVLLSASLLLSSASSFSDKQNYVLDTNTVFLHGSKQHLNSTGFEGAQSCQVEKPAASSAYPPGYDPNMTPEQKKAYALARSAAIAVQKEQLNNQPLGTLQIPDWVRKLSSYEQKEWFKANMSIENLAALQETSRKSNLGNARYQEELLRFMERERRESIRKRDRVYH